MKQSTRRWLWWVGLVGLCLVSVATRLLGLTADGFWFDELLTAEYAAGGGDVTLHLPHDQPIVPVPTPTELGQHPVWAIWTGLDGTVHPPLFYMAARCWASVFGATDVGYRSWSLVCSTGSVLLLAWLVRRLHGRRAGLIAGLLLALAAPQIYFGHDAKHYPQATLTLLAAGLVASCTAYGWRRSVVLALLLVAAPLTHYFTVGAAAAIAGWAFGRATGGERWRLAICGTIAALVGILAWGPQVLRARGDGFSTSLWVDDYVNLLPQLARQVGELPLGMLVYTSELPGWVLALSWGLWIVPALACWRGRDSALALWVVWFPVALLPALLASLWLNKEVIAYPRYTVFAAPALCALVAAGMTRASMTLRPGPRELVRWGVPAAAVLLVSVELGRPYTRFMADHEPIGAYIDANAKPGDALVIVVEPANPLLHCGLFMSIAHYAGGERFSELWLMRDRMAEPTAERVWLVKPAASGPIALDGYELRRIEGYPPVGSTGLWVRATPGRLPE
ncbi:MAG: glycosyltransferase family 39 protein [Planctomycetota bacterium]